ncbi:hypothetical protein INT47_002175 [Mucor saturninus]|uniref:Replication protein A subunit n=1 Tax=Mucor saturninus TaxID=64648 RepID=A0A8H7R8J8_9FUNG|nr:hypothetical protein INT47_002175 [Mucor saturninus]
MVQLTAGAIKVLYDDDKSSPLYSDPFVQVINIKAVAVAGGTRYRVILSDGIHFMQAMLAASHTSLVENQSLKRNSIIRLKESVCNLLQNRKILIVLGFDVIESDVDSKVGAPITLEGHVTPATPKAEGTSQTSSPVPKPATTFNSGGINMQLEASLTPIKNLNPYQTRWTIKARVTQKSPIRKWHNARGDGQLFSVNFLDQTGEIKATAFNDQVDRLYNMFEEGKVYYISKARVTMAKKQFSTLNNEYELGLEHGTEIEACGSESAIPQMNYDFVKVSDLEKYEKGTNIDIVGVVTEDLGLSEIVNKISGKPTNKRELTIVDESCKSVRMTLWDTVAEQFDSSNNPVIACKGVRVNDFNGRTLSLGGGGSIKKNPDLPEAHKLRKWYSDKAGSIVFDSYSSNMGGGMDHGPSAFMTLQQAKVQNLGHGEKPDYFSFKGTVVYIKSENPAYAGCPICKKKVSMEENGWRCESCQKLHNAPVYRYILTASVEDSTSQIYVNGFDEFGQALLKVSANELIALKDNDAGAAQKVINRALFQTFNFKVRAKTESYNDLTRVKYSCVSVSPIDFLQESKNLVTAIEKLLL